MDRALKERIIGAVVLVLVAILVVPVFLDGPSNDPEIISEPVSLPGQNDQERIQKTIVLERDRTEPIPSTGNNVPTQPVVQQSPDQMAPDETPAKESAEPSEHSMSTAVASSTEKESVEEATKPVESASETAVSPTKTQPESATGMWAVQLGSFSNEDNADRLAADLRKQGFAAFLSRLQTASGELHRVRVGPQKDRDSAETVAATLQRNGHRSQVVPHP